MAYGTPRSRDELLPYYTHIRRGSPPPPELVDELASRYDAIGGLSPLFERTNAQLGAIEAALDAVHPGAFVVALGQRHATPFIEDGVAALHEAGVRRVVGLVLAPHYSGASVGQYHQRARTAVEAGGATYVPVDYWYDVPEYTSFLASAIRDAQAAVQGTHKVLFTAHSLPERVLDGDPYPEQLRAGAAAVGDLLGFGPWTDWTMCWQSAGRTGDAWRGPDINDVLRALASTGRAEGVVVCPHGFVADGLEVLYDVDIQARDTATGLGLAFSRTRSLNDEPMVMRALAARIALRAAS
jgi:ferrochelatase